MRPAPRRMIPPTRSYDAGKCSMAGPGFTYRRGCVNVYIYTVTVHSHLHIPVCSRCVEYARTK